MRALVTGVSGQDGYALAEQLIAEGHEVYGMVRWTSGTRRTRIEQALPTVRLVDGDLCDQTSLQRVLQLTRPRVVYNLGALASSGQSWAQPMVIGDTNALGPLRVYDAFVARVRAAPGTRAIVNISSESGSLGAFRASSKPEYALSKAALNALTRWVAVQEAAHGVCCVSLDPGWTQTGMGGAGAPHAPEQTAARLCAAIDRLTPAHSGGFFDADLRALAW